ncbi:hypothetical protein [Sphingomonas crocodyli]|uniref:Uncharacterized protein n=1 Tax=Sphingomonas crocodyli TaxID=1979270 RepID=A0A437M6U1_9SPHN|nr:hypothetical protein [Sphingomonas crocodyli]RVT93428.1 hypothetical protein EOD43_06005 [Sphingomonas crocodyli]
MSDRVVISLDVTFEEARAIAERIAGVGPYYEAMNLPIALDEVEEMAVDADKLRRVYIRSDASAALGGPDGAPSR